MFGGKQWKEKIKEGVGDDKLLGCSESYLFMVSTNFNRTHV